MKAAVLHDARDVIIEDLPEPVVEPDGVIIKVKACGICGSDIHLYGRGGRGDTVMGHEFSGDVVEVGTDVTGVEVGDRFVAMSGRGCGKCYWCQQGQWISCKRMMLLGYGIQGAFAEYVAIPHFRLGEFAARLPESLTYEEGATAEPLSVALHAVEQTQPQSGDSIVVIGAGVIGLCVVQILKSMGISQIIVSGHREGRLNIARESGASTVVDAAKENVVPIVNELTSGKGADIVFECAGLSTTFQQAMEMVHRGGKVDLVGLYGQPINWNPTFIVGNDVTLIGCGLQFELPGAIDLLQRGKVNTKPMITHQFPLDSIKEAFETQINAQDAIKVLVKP